MKHLPLLLLVALLVSCAKEISTDKLVERDGIVYEEFSSDPFTGSVHLEVEEPEGGKMLAKGSLKDGRQEGLWETFYEDGQLFTKVYLDGGR